MSMNFIVVLRGWVSGVVRKVVAQHAGFFAGDLLPVDEPLAFVS